MAFLIILKLYLELKFWYFNFLVIKEVEKYLLIFVEFIKIRRILVMVMIRILNNFIV